MKGERGESEVDEYFETISNMAGPGTYTPFQKVKFDDPEDIKKCWADEFYESGTVHGCFNDATTDVGLCDAHHKEVVGDQSVRGPQVRLHATDALQEGSEETDS